MSRTPEQAYSELIRRTREASVLASCGSVLNWDEATYMPRQGSAYRGEQVGLLARLGHEMTTSPVVGELLAEVEGSSLVSDPESDVAVNVREIRRGYDRAVKVPAALVEELARVSTRAQQVWRDARKASSFALFRPELTTLVRLLRDKADAIGYTASRYDALLDEYEPGATAAEITAVFAALQKELVPLIAAIHASGKQPDRKVLQREFAVDLQKMFAASAAAAIGFDFEAGRLDVSAHPFCSGIGPGDCRLTTRYNVHRFNEAFFGVLHEAGHGIYEQGLPAEHAGTPRGSFCSLGIHESQSRLWENQVGRGRPFWEHFFPRARQTFPAALHDVAFDTWMFAINDVQPSFIRVEADEATYNLHIILRFELEQAILADQLPVADVPAAWNERFERMFGLKVENDAQGCLQDIHWSLGGLGYFPTYTLGNLYAAQLMEAARRDLAGIDDDFRRGDFGRLKGWLNAHVHAAGQRWRAGELCRRVTGRPLEPAPLLRYLRDKYAPFYGLS
ncbi:MAG: carboxypeptidase M32 [Gemmataceae bacterium]